MIVFNQGMLFLGSNHFLTVLCLANRIQANWATRRLHVYKYGCPTDIQLWPIKQSPAPTAVQVAMPYMKELSVGVQKDPWDLESNWQVTPQFSNSECTSVKLLLLRCIFFLIRLSSSPLKSKMMIPSVGKGSAMNEMQGSSILWYHAADKGSWRYFWIRGSCHPEIMLCILG